MDFATGNVSSALAVFLALTILIHTIIHRWRNRRLIKFMAQFPGPIPLPFVGSAYIYLKQFNTTSVVRFLLQLLANAEETESHWLGGSPYIMTTNREIINAIVTNLKNIDKTKDYDSLKVISAGIFTATGNQWRKTRKIVNPGFRTNVLDSFDDNFSYHIKIFLESISRLADTGEEHDVFRACHAFTLDSFCDNMLGVRIDIQKRRLFNFSISVEESMNMFFTRAFNPLLWSDFVYSLLGKTKKLADVSRDMRLLAEDVLNKRLAMEDLQRKEDIKAGQPKYFLELLIDAIESKEISREQCIEEIIELFVAGSLTSAISIAWLIKGAAMYPNMADKMYRELIEVCGVREITQEDLSKLPYLDMIVKELLRHITLPIIARHITNDIRVNDNIVIPAGMNVMMPIFGLHHDPRFWERPNEFYPEHFSPENEAKRPKGVYLPFSSGPRNCPGNKYAVRVVKILVANMMLHFNCSSSEPTPTDIINDLDYRIALLVCPIKGWRVRFHRRRQEPEKTQVHAAA
ncbi:unnamed protein product [Bemisia tabaci]|uniref:Cytochrome P450 n=1 Tax=Bemisia tabaci TaxID=7038 RepID=A0A9P0FA86_BEMTA|nr:unnamed protein product [Bemisia tabaci]